MRVRKCDSLGSQPIHLRRAGLGIAFQYVVPVIEIINGNEQNVWLTVVSFTGLVRQAEQQNGESEYR